MEFEYGLCCSSYDIGTLHRLQDLIEFTSPFLMKIEELYLRSWSLSSGAGGEYYYHHDGYHGGGGGGVLVDGAGPEASAYHGQGFGGGGNGYYNYGDGLQGVVMIEIV